MQVELTKLEATTDLDLWLEDDLTAEQLPTVVSASLLGCGSCGGWGGGYGGGYWGGCGGYGGGYWGYWGGYGGGCGGYGGGYWGGSCGSC